MGGFDISHSGRPDATERGREDRGSYLDVHCSRLYRLLYRGGNLVEAPDQLLRVAGGDVAAAQAAIAARSVSVSALQYAVQGRLRRDEILGRISSAATAIKKANAALVEALEHDRWTLEDVKGLVGEAKELKPAITELSKQASELLDRVKILSPARLLR